MKTGMGHRPPGVILAGGRAARMGGGDKGFRAVAGMRLIDHVLARLAGQCGAVAINANGDPARFAEFGLPVLADPLPGHPGPLAGVLAGMEWAAAQGAEAVISVAVDTPFFPPDLVARLQAEAHAAAAGGRPGLVLAASLEAGLEARLEAGPKTDGRLMPQPTFGLWPVALRRDLRLALEGGVRRITAFTQAHGATFAAFAPEPHDPFFNVNTPEDIETARAYAARKGG